jgi:hypothetical protein
MSEYTKAQIAERMAQPDFDPDRNWEDHEILLASKNKSHTLTEAGMKELNITDVATASYSEATGTPKHGAGGTQWTTAYVLQSLFDGSRIKLEFDNTKDKELFMASLSTANYRRNKKLVAKGDDHARMSIQAESFKYEEAIHKFELILTSAPFVAKDVTERYIPKFTILPPVGENI